MNQSLARLFVIISTMGAWMYAKYSFSFLKFALEVVTTSL